MGNIIKVNLKEREFSWEGMDWIYLAQDGVQLGESCEHGKELSGSIKKKRVGS
jgi:hypothetical protein